MELKCYLKKGDRVAINFLKVIDLPGSERLINSQTEANNKGILNLSAAKHSISLLFLAKTIDDINALKKPIMAGDKIPKIVS